MMELEPKIKQTLQNINFVERYECLSNNFNDKRTPLKERLRFIDGEIIMDSLVQLGYEVDFDSKGKYFKVKEEQIKNHTFSVNIILENGLVDLVWVVKENGKLILGLPIGEYSRLIISPSYRIKKPIFGTYDDLDEIFRVSFQLFEDFKRTVSTFE